MRFHNAYQAILNDLFLKASVSEMSEAKRLKTHSNLQWKLVTGTSSLNAGTIGHVVYLVVVLDNFESS